MNVAPQVSKQFHYVGGWLTEALLTFLPHLTLPNWIFFHIVSKWLIKARPPFLPSPLQLHKEIIMLVGDWQKLLALKPASSFQFEWLKKLRNKH